VTRAGRAALLVIGALLVSTASGWSEPRVIDLSIRNRELPRDQRVVRVRQGDDVTLRWVTDGPLTVHLHGYDIETKLAPGPAIVMRFPARATGRFPIEIHGQGFERTLGYLEVHPR
jgi:hypothetical protein